jgi:hypothetical protein
MFHDTAPQHRLPNPTRAECDAADEAHAQEVAATRGATCFALAEALSVTLDKRAAEWSADDKPLLDQMFNLLAEAQAIGERLS